MSSLSCDFFGPQGRCFSRNEFAHVKADVGVGDEVDAGGGDLIQLDLKADEIHVSEGPTSAVRSDQDSISRDPCVRGGRPMWSSRSTSELARSRPTATAMKTRTSDSLALPTTML